MLRLVGSALLCAVAVVIAADRPGLQATYITHVGERTIWSPVDPEVRIEPDLPAAIFRYSHQFRARWTGWIDIAETTDYRFRVSSSGPIRFAIDGRELVPKGRRKEVKHAQVELTRGPHRFELEFDHVGLTTLFATEMRPPRSDWKPLPSEALYRRRPAPVRRLIRGVTTGLGTVGSRLAASTLGFLAVLLITGSDPGRRTAAWWKRRVAWWSDLAAAPRRCLELLGLGFLALGAGLVVFPSTGSPFGWDDVRYLDLAVSGRTLNAYLNRFAHVYLLKPFIWIAGGDPFLGARIFWSFQFGLIVASLAVAARSLGARLQGATFVASLFLVFSQPLFFLRAGASVPDTTVATLVMVSVALYLHRRARGPTAVFEWQILTIGALTVWAVKSKELGAILLWLPVLMVFERGRPDWRSLTRKVGFWLAGAAAGLALLMVLDGIYFDDPLHGLRPSNQRAVSEINFADDPQQARDAEGWMDILGQGRTPVAGNNPRMRYMALLVVLAALVAAHRKRSIELRLLHLMPILYVLLLILVHVRATYVFLPRYLYPMVPLSCFLVAAGLHYLGLDELSWRELGKPWTLLAVFALGFLLFGIALPYEAGRLPAREFLPADWLAGVGWESLDSLVRLVLAPALVLGLVLALALAYSHRVGRLLLVVSLIVLFLGQPFRRTLQDLGMARPWQRGETNLHPLRVLGHEIPQRRRVWVEVSPSFTRGLEMFGEPVTCAQIVKLYLGRRDLRVTTWVTLDPEQDIAFLTRGDYDYWRRIWPALEEKAVSSPGGEFVVVFPSATEVPAPRSK